MSELAVKPSVNESNETAPDRMRRIVSYFDHEFIEPSSKKVERDVEEMIDAGFTNVVLCITEKDIASPARLDFLKDTVSHMKGRELTVWADPWSVGGVFGGEGGSPFSESGEKRCMDNPKLDCLLGRWIDASASTGIDTVFWDEPEMKDCVRHRNGEVEFLEKYTAAAGRLALKSVVCLCADESKKHQLAQVASMPDVIEIATDPYVPSVFIEMTPEERQTYIERTPTAERVAYITHWADYTRQVAELANVRSHVWIQGFSIPKGYESIISEHVAACQEGGVKDLAFWGFNGCESVPNFSREGNASPKALWSTIKNAIKK